MNDAVLFFMMKGKDGKESSRTTLGGVLLNKGGWSTS
jgi:hypothetical protein